MSLGQQVREWLGGLWSDFWRVPLRGVLTAIGFVLWAVVELVWRTEAAFNATWRASYDNLFPPRILLALLLLFFAGRQFPR